MSASGVLCCVEYKIHSNVYIYILIIVFIVWSTWHRIVLHASSLPVGQPVAPSNWQLGGAADRRAGTASGQEGGDSTAFGRAGAAPGGPPGRSHRRAERAEHPDK